MVNKLNVVDKTVLEILDCYIVDHYDWREYWAKMGDVLTELREGAREQV
jgi:hypothetical protein